MSLAGHALDRRTPHSRLLFSPFTVRWRHGKSQLYLPRALTSFLLSFVGRTQPMLSYAILCCPVLSTPSLLFSRQHVRLVRLHTRDRNAISDRWVEDIFDTADACQRLTLRDSKQQRTKQRGVFSLPLEKVALLKHPLVFAVRQIRRRRLRRETG